MIAHLTREVLTFRSWVTGREVVAVIRYNSDDQYWAEYQRIRRENGINDLMEWALL